MRTKGATGKKKVVKKVVVDKEVECCEPVVRIAELEKIGHEELHGIIAKVNEIIKFINK